ncbi:YEATS domain-containing protein 2 [Lobulomyces angularis]|nr:YEATS domain-containing protein 2 [Lobulomyces angularis]
MSFAADDIREKVIKIINEQFDYEILIKNQEISQIKTELKKAEHLINIINENLIPRIISTTRSGKILSATPLSATQKKQNTSNDNSNTLIVNLDNNFLKIVCPGCQRTNFSNMQGFINHSRISCGGEFSSHFEASKICGHPIDENEVPENHPARKFISYSIVTPKEVPQTTVKRGKINVFEEEVDLETSKRVVNDFGKMDVNKKQTTEKINLNKSKPFVSSNLRRESTPATIDDEDDESESSKNQNFGGKGFGTRFLPTAKSSIVEVDAINGEEKLDNGDDTLDLDNEDIEGGDQSHEEGEEEPAKNSTSVKESHQNENDLDNFSKTSSSEPKYYTPESSSRFYIQRKVLVGNVCQSLSEVDSNSNKKHKWMIYLRGPNMDPDVSTFVKKVRFFLHPSYKPYDVVDVTTPPFHLTRSGWGEFPIRLQVHFVDSRNKPVNLIHILKLDKFFSGKQVLGLEQIFDLELDKNTAFGPVIPERKNNTEKKKKKKAVIAEKDAKEMIVNDKESIAKENSQIETEIKLVKRDTRQTMPSEADSEPLFFNRTVKTAQLVIDLNKNAVQPLIKKNEEVLDGAKLTNIEEVKDLNGAAPQQKDITTASNEMADPVLQWQSNTINSNNKINMDLGKFEDRLVNPGSAIEENNCKPPFCENLPMIFFPPPKNKLEIRVKSAGTIGDTSANIPPILLPGLSNGNHTTKQKKSKNEKKINKAIVYPANHSFSTLSPATTNYTNTVALETAYNISDKNSIKIPKIEVKLNLLPDLSNFTEKDKVDIIKIFELINNSILMFPLLRTDRRVVNITPYTLCPSQSEWTKWSHGKKAAHEWLRAKALKSHLQEKMSDTCKFYFTTKVIVKWLKLSFPPGEEIKDSNEDASSSNSNCNEIYFPPPPPNIVNFPVLPSDAIAFPYPHPMCYLPVRPIKSPTTNASLKNIPVIYPAPTPMIPNAHPPTISICNYGNSINPPLINSIYNVKDYPFLPNINTYPDENKVTLREEDEFMFQEFISKIEHPVDNVKEKKKGSNFLIFFNDNKQIEDPLNLIQKLNFELLNKLNYCIFCGVKLCLDERRHPVDSCPHRIKNWEKIEEFDLNLKMSKNTNKVSFQKNFNFEKILEKINSNLRCNLNVNEIEFIWNNVETLFNIESSINLPIKPKNFFRKRNSINNLNLIEFTPNVKTEETDFQSNWVTTGGVFLQVLKVFIKKLLHSGVEIFENEVNENFKEEKILMPVHIIKGILKNQSNFNFLLDKKIVLEEEI